MNILTYIVSWLLFGISGFLFGRALAIKDRIHNLKSKSQIQREYDKAKAYIFIAILVLFIAFFIFWTAIS